MVTTTTTTGSGQDKLIPTLEEEIDTDSGLTVGPSTEESKEVEEAVKAVVDTASEVD